MPTFGFEYLRVAKYNNNNGSVTYGNPVEAGCPISINLELQFAEGNLYACDGLSESVREAIGGTASLATKLLPAAAQALMYGATAKSRSVTYTEDSTQQTKNVSSVPIGAEDVPQYVGVTGYGKDKVDGVTKYTAFAAFKALFSPPSLSYATKTDSITFQTPTTTGRLLPSDATGKAIYETATCDSAAEAKAWCDAVLPTA